MFKKLPLIIVTALSLMLGSLVFADSPVCGDGFKKMIESVKMDQTQKDKIKPVLDNLKTNIAQSSRQMADIEKQLWAQVSAPTMDQAAISDLIDKKVKLIGDIMKAKSVAKGQVFAILNADQKQEIINKMVKWHEKMEEKWKSCHE